MFYIKFQYTLFLFFIQIFDVKSQVTITDKEYLEYTKTKQKLKFSFRDSVQLQLKDMAYACGDCYPNYRIDKVFFSEENSKVQASYLNKEIYVDFVGKNIKNQLEKMTCSATCYTYVLYGVLKQNGYGMLKLEATGGKISVNSKCCEK